MTTYFARQSMFQSAGKWVLSGALFSFAAAIVLAPVRYRIMLEARPLPPVYRDYTDLLLFPADVAVLCMVTLWAMSLLFAPRRIALGPRLIWIPLLALTLVGWASVLASLDPVLSVYHAIRLSVLFWFYLFIVNEVRSLAWIYVPIGLQIAVQAIIALGQFALQHSLGLQMIGEAALDPLRPGVSVVAAGGSRLLRAYGLADHPNILGGCLAFGMLVMISVYLSSARPWLPFGLLLVAAIALLVTFSRAAWLAFLLGGLLLALLDFMLRRRALLARWLWLLGAWAAIMVGFILVYADFLGVRFNVDNSFNTPSMEQQSIGERALLVQSAALIISEHPGLGVGLGAAPQALARYEPNWPVAFEPPHSAMLDAAEEIGLSGAFLYVALTAAPFIMCFWPTRPLLGNPAAATSLALLLAVVAVGLFDYYTWMLVAGRLWQWLAWGLWARGMTQRSVTARAESLRTVQPATSAPVSGA